MHPLHRALSLSEEISARLGQASRTSDALLNRYLSGESPASWDEQLRTVSATLLTQLQPPLDDAWAELDQLQGEVPLDQWDIVLAAWRARVLPYFLQVPMARRSFDKPLGYPGDYGIVRMIYEAPGDAPTALGKALTDYVWNVGPCRAHRARRPWSIGHLREMRARQGRPLRVMSYACGPEHTLQTWITEAPDTVVRLYDAEPLALNWCQKRFRSIGQRIGRPLQVTGRVVPSGELIAGRTDLEDARLSDVILVLGLFDYLSPEEVGGLVDHLMSVLQPGGRLLCTNLNVHNPWRPLMEMMGAWQVAHRHVDEVVGMILHGRSDLRVIDARLDESGTNVFVAVERKLDL